MLKLKSKMTTPHLGWPYVEPSTGHLIRDEVYENLVQRVLDHKKAHGIALTDTWREEIEDSVCLHLEVEDWDRWCIDPDNAPVPRMVSEGRKLWAELHQHAMNFPVAPEEDDRMAALAWFRGWEARVPSLNCKCARNWKSLALGQPDVSSRKSYYVWTVIAHDKVREKLGQPIMEGEFRHLVD